MDSNRIHYFSIPLFGFLGRIAKLGRGSRDQLAKKSEEMASKIAEAVRNSPLINRRKGGYSPVTQASTDPFTKGITFHIDYIATLDVEDRVGTERVQGEVRAAVDNQQKSKKPMRKVAVTVKAVSLTVADLLTRAEVSYPIYLVSYCGTCDDIDVIFFFIHKSREDKKLRAEVFKCSDTQKVDAITRTLSKAFTIAYKAWQMKKRQQEKSEGGAASPLLQKRNAPTKSPLEAVKAVGATGGFYSPQLPVKPAARRRSSSLEKEKEAMAFMAAANNPALSRLKVENEATGKAPIRTLKRMHHAHT